MSEWLKIDVRERERERERERWRVRERNIAQAERGGKRGVIERERERERLNLTSCLSLSP